MDKEELYNLIAQRNPHRRGGNEVIVEIGIVSPYFLVNDL